MTAHKRERLTPDAMRAVLIESGLKEASKPIDGYAWTYWKHPTTAVNDFPLLRGGMEAKRFYLLPHYFILSE